jgi:hypothetical protein
MEGRQSEVEVQDRAGCRGKHAGMCSQASASASARSSSRQPSTQPPGACPLQYLPPPARGLTVGWRMTRAHRYASTAPVSAAPRAIVPAASQSDRIAGSRSSIGTRNSGCPKRGKKPTGPQAMKPSQRANKSPNCQSSACLARPPTHPPAHTPHPPDLRKFVRMPWLSRLLFFRITLQASRGGRQGGRGCDGRREAGREGEREAAGSEHPGLGSRGSGRQPAAD